MDESLRLIASQEIAQCRREGLDDEDTLNYAIGACVRASREMGMLDDEFPVEMEASLAALVKSLMADPGQ